MTLFLTCDPSGKLKAGICFPSCSLETGADAKSSQLRSVPRQSRPVAASTYLVANAGTCSLERNSDIAEERGAFWFFISLLSGSSLLVMRQRRAANSPQIRVSVVLRRAFLMVVPMIVDNFHPHLIHIVVIISSSTIYNKKT